MTAACGVSTTSSEAACARGPGVLTVERLRVAFLHLRPRLGDLHYNCACLETAVRTAADWGADWILTPELSLPGYQFLESLGSDWIAPLPDPWVDRVSQWSAELDTVIFFGHPERDRQSDRLYNSLMVIESGTIVGVHRKINVVPGGAERWSTRGTEAVPVRVGGLVVGLLIGADGYTPDAARRLRDEGAEILVSAAAWGPYPHGPEHCWDQRTRETGLPLFVCTRMGHDRTLSLAEAESVVVKDGTRLVSLRTADSSVLLVDWDVAAETVIAWRHEPLEFGLLRSLAAQ